MASIKKFVSNNFSVDCTALHAENSERFVLGAKPQATSSKQQAKCDKLQATSSKRQASSSKHQAASRKQQAGGSESPYKVSSR